MISPGEPASLSGQDLLAEFSRGGHEGPFEEIVRRYAGMVFNVCLKVTRDKHEAEDATQAVFLTLAVQVKRGTDIKALGPWLQQVARRLALDMKRSQKRRKRREEQHHDLHTVRREELNDAAVCAPDIDELKTILHEELEKLPAKYRLPLILHYFGGLSRDEMAGELNCKPSTLGVRIFRGRQMLAGKLSSRGVTLPDETMGLMLGMTVKSTLTESAIRGSGHAAAAVACGHDVVGLLSHRVIALSRRATSALLIGKVKLVITIAAMALMSLGAFAKAAGMLPNLTMDRLLVEPIRRLIQPLLQPLTTPLQAVAVVDRSVSLPAAVVETPAVKLVIPPIVAAAKTAAPPVITKADAAVAPAVATAEVIPLQAPATVRAEVSSDASVMTASMTHPISDPSETATLARAADAIEASAGDTLMGAGGGGGFGGGVAMNTPDLYLPPSHSTGSSGTSMSAAYAGVVQIQTQNGKVLAQDGVMRGWGKIARTGTFDANGKVIADGDGIDRTLDLTGFSAIRCSDPNSSDGGQNGWYAVDHGRLDMKLQASNHGTVLTWGDAATAPQLTLVNSARLSLTSTSEARPTALSLLAFDRSDLPTFAGMAGTPIGLWQVDSPDGDVDSADVTIRYDDSAIQTLGADEFGVRMWFFTGDQWQLASPASFHLDVTDHLATGTGESFSYFALSVPTLTPMLADLNLLASPATQLSMSFSAAELPEPAGMLVLGTISVSMMRRRRSSRSK